VCKLLLVVASSLLLRLSVPLPRPAGMAEALLLGAWRWRRRPTNSETRLYFQELTREPSSPLQTLGAVRSFLRTRQVVAKSASSCTRQRSYRTGRGRPLLLSPLLEVALPRPQWHLERLPLRPAVGRLVFNLLAWRRRQHVTRAKLRLWLVVRLV